MTARSRSRLRYASLFTVATLIAMALGLLMVHSTYDSAYADGAAAVAPPVHDPLTNPGAYADDVRSLASAGQWSALGVAFLIGAFQAVNALADRRRSQLLATYSAWFAAGAAIAATMLVFLATQHWLDWQVALAVAGVVGAAAARMPGHRLPDDGVATSPVATSSPRTPEAGCARLNLVLTLGILATAALLASVACTSPTVRSARHSVTQTVVDCGKAEVQDLATDLVPAVTAIVTGDTPSWRAQLDALLAAGVHAGACAIRTVGHDLATRAAQAVTGAHAEGQERVGAEHAAEYLQARGFVFEVQR